MGTGPGFPTAEEGANQLFGQIFLKLRRNKENWTGVGGGDVSKMLLCRATSDITLIRKENRFYFYGVLLCHSSYERRRHLSPHQYPPVT